MCRGRNSLPLLVDELAFGGDECAAKREDTAFSAQRSSIWRDRAHEIHFGLDRAVADARRQRRMAAQPQQLSIKVSAQPP